MRPPDRYDVTASAKFGAGFRTPGAGTVELLYDVSVMDAVPVAAGVLVTYVSAERSEGGSANHWHLHFDGVRAGSGKQNGLGAAHCLVFFRPQG